MTTEKVMVLEKEIADEYGFSTPGVHTVIGGGFKEMLERCIFKRRKTVETDEQFLQIIPYVVFECRRKVFAYRRGSTGGESRLHGAWSIGVGGHINFDDGWESNFQNYQMGVLREVEEEIGYSLPIVPSPSAIIFDDSTPVSRVHLGFVHVINLSEEFDLLHIEGCLVDPFFIGLTQIAMELFPHLEPWSRMVYTVLKTITR